MKTLEGDLVKLRALEPEDLEILYKWENDTSVWGVSNTVAPYSKFVLKMYIQSASKDIYSGKQLRLVIMNKKTNEPVGLVDLFDFDAFNSKVGVGILISETEQRNKGFAQESLALMIDYVKSHLGLKQLYCEITTDNTASIHLFEKAGFVHCGVRKSWVKDGDTWKDEAMYQLVF